MDEAVEMVVTGTKYQNYQTIICMLFSGINGVFFYMIPFLFKNPALLNNSQVNNENVTNIHNYTLEEMCLSNNIHTYIDNKSSFNNYSLIHKLFCKDNTFLFEIIIFLYYSGKGINSIILGYLSDKYGRLIILLFGPILTAFSFIFLFFGINNLFLLILGTLLIGACSYF